LTNQQPYKRDEAEPPWTRTRFAVHNISFLCFVVCLLTEVARVF
jgi:hypothetical protein